MQLFDATLLALSRHGMNAEEVLTIVRNGLGGEPVSVLLDGVKRFDIAVRLAEVTRDSVEALRRIPLRAASGALVPLGEVAEVNVAEGYSFVRREQLQRYAVIQMDVRGRDVDGFVKEAAAAVDAQLDLPPGYWIEWGGAFENRMRFPLELFAAVRAVWPEDKVLGVRISATDWIPGGWDLDQSVVFSQRLKALLGYSDEEFPDLPAVLLQRVKADTRPVLIEGLDMRDNIRPVKKEPSLLTARVSRKEAGHHEVEFLKIDIGQCPVPIKTGEGDQRLRTECGP